MDPHLLRTFVAVARHGSFSAAARELGYTQSAVSQHIAALEGDLAVPLLERRPVRPTEAGERLLEHAGPLLLRLDAARADVARPAAAPTARLTVGVSPPATPLLARLLTFRRELTVTIRVLDRAAIPAAVSSGDLDLGLTDGMTAPSDPLPLPETGPLTATVVAESPLCVALPAAHPLARRPGLRLPDLADALWIDAPGTAVPPDRLRAVCGPGAYRTRLRYEGTDVRGLLALVAAGQGLAVLPAAAVAGLDDVVGVPVAAPRLVHRVEALHGGRPADAVQRLLGPGPFTPVGGV
ncbi:LysR family transcriptional regulator [Streptomyces sp. AV19]|uniref:LysR family transcriptional regulator n=1 Tax=Streptomyces sp. AV19 TaxID=2793068 RepID=UPI0018FE3B49|nr:LysR family transcriptional regulator [Streptomyces sp. AV19]MBH1933893.1 LysR family transcriptional regulator [Streptomyces sp. AV19]MDG4535619.1 LysR family transcriptional regulator [Streptomyces sp. AV19]